MAKRTADQAFNLLPERYTLCADKPFNAAPDRFYTINTPERDNARPIKKEREIDISSGAGPGLTEEKEPNPFTVLGHHSPHLIEHSTTGRILSTGKKVKLEYGAIGRTLSPGKEVKFNLPNLKIPQQLFKQDEKIMSDLHILLRDHGFEVIDRPTLAFFAIGKQFDVEAAAQCFLEFHKLASCAEFKNPDRARLEQMEVDGFIEGFAHYGETFGTLFNCGNWNPENNLPIYIVREKLCYVLKMVDLSFLIHGSTDVINMRNVTWGKFAPYDMVKSANYMTRCLPLRQKRVLFVNPNYYASVALRVIIPMIVSRIRAVAYVLSADEARKKFHVVLPPSITPTTRENRNFTHLSADQQLDFQFLIE